MDITVCQTTEKPGVLAAEAGAEHLRQVLKAKSRAVVALAAGSSQIVMLEHLVRSPGIDWGQVIAFPLDEYVGLSAKHPSSFGRYLQERFIDGLPSDLAAFHGIDGAAEDPVSEAVRVSRLLQREALDVAFIGIGENGHIAFNDPPADFDTEEPYLVVDLDERCRQQQINEGWFPSLEEVPDEAISMSVRQILTSERLICTVSEERKAEAVKAAIEGKVTAQVPASILQEHENCQLFLDEAAAMMLSRE